MQADENSAATTEADLTLEEDQWLRISKLEAQLRAKEQDVELAATIGQDLLSQVTALNARVAELEALKQAAPSPTATAAEEEYTPNKREHDTTIQKSSKIPLARVSARRPSSAQHYHNTPSNNATTTPKEQVSYTPAAATTQSQSSHQQPFAPMARTSTIDKTLAEHIENALVLQLRSLQLKMTSVETQRLQLMEKCDSLDQNRALLKNQNEKLAASEKKLNEKIWDLEILNQQLKETNETLQKEITRHLQKIRTCEKELSNVKKYNEVMRRAEAAWTKEKQGILFKMESESNRKRREIANLRREKDSLEKQVEDLNKASAATLTGGAPDRLRLKTSPSKTATRSDSFVGKLETLFEAGSNGGNSTKNLYEEFLAQQQQQLDTQAANNELFLNSLSKALSRAHAQNEELRRENAGLHLDTQELNRLLVEANETIESLKLGFNLSSLEKFEGFDPSFQLESSFFQTENSMSLHDQMVLSESFHDLSYFNAEESFMLPGSKSLLAELQSESPKEMSPPSANINFLAELESETAPLQEKVSLRKVLENSSSETLNAHDIYDDNIGLESIGEIDFSPIEKDGFGPAKNIEFTSVMDSDDLGPTEEIDFAPGIDLTQDIIFVPAEVDTLSFEQNEKIDFAPIKRVNFDLTETVEFEPNETSFKSNSSVEKEHVSKTETADFSCQTDTQSVDPKSILSEFSQSNFVGGLESGVFEAEDGTGIPEVSSSFEGDISFSGSLGLSFIEPVAKEEPIKEIDAIDASFFSQTKNDTDNIRPQVTRKMRQKTSTTTHFHHRSETSFNHQTNTYDEYDAAAIEALTSTMIGTWFLKLNRHGKKPQLRFFWVNPYSRLLNWTAKPANTAISATQGTVKTAYIQSVKWGKPSEIHKNYPPNTTHAIEIVSLHRSIVMIPLSWNDHKSWTVGLDLLLQKSSEIESPQLPLPPQQQSLASMSFLSLTGHSTSMMTGGGNSESFLPLLERFKIVDTKDMLAELHAGPAWRGPTGGSAGDGKKAAGEVAGDGTRNLVRRATSLGEMATAAAAAKTRMMTKSTNAVSAASTRISRTTPPPPPPSSSSTPSPTPRSSGRTTPVFRPAGSRIREFSLRDAVVGGSESVSGSSGIRVGKRSTSVGGRASPALKIFSRMSVFTSSSLATSSVTTTTTTTTTTSENE